MKVTYKPDEHVTHVEETYLGSYGQTDAAYIARQLTEISTLLREGARFNIVWLYAVESTFEVDKEFTLDEQCKSQVIEDRLKLFPNIDAIFMGKRAAEKFQDSIISTIHARNFGLVSGGNAGIISPTYHAPNGKTLTVFRRNISESEVQLVTWRVIDA